MSSDIKEFRVSESAMASLSPSSYKGGRRRKTRKQHGGELAGSLTQLAGQSAAAGYVAPDAQTMAAKYAANVDAALKSSFGPQVTTGQRGGNTGAIVNLSSTRPQPPVVPGSAEPVPVVSGIAVSQPASAQAGGSNQAKIVLAAPKRKTRIALRAKKLGGSSAGDVPPPPTLGGAKTHKARKIHLRVKGVTSRLNKAKKAKKQAHTAPLATIRNTLEKAGIIKKDSKAPEKMLRTMYADLLITKKGL